MKRSSLVWVAMVLASVCSLPGQRISPSIDLFESRALAPFAPAWNEWLHLPTATNDWASSIRKLNEWNQVARSPIEETRVEAEKGSVVAQLKLGFSYFVGDGIERSFSQSLKWLQKPGTRDLAPAQLLIGLAYLNGLGVEPDFAEGVDWLDKAARQDLAEAQLELGLCYLRGGPGVAQAPARGWKWVQRAAEQGIPQAQHWLGWCYTTGIGTKPDPEEAVTWFRRAAEQGFAPAQDFLGLCYSVGNGVPSDPAEAARWYRKAAEQGFPLAIMHLAKSYARGAGVEKDPVKAADWWQKAADLGLPSACFHYGLSLYLGEGRPKEPETAVPWFEKAAAQGHVGAQLYLGLAYWTGEGVPEDRDEAVKYWREACLRGLTRRPADAVDSDAEIEGWWRAVAPRANARVQCALAESYHFGRGVPRNETEALRWYKLAAKDGEVVALKNAAWILATSETGDLRDGRQAVEFAEKAAAASKRQDAGILDTLAAAYAETGDFKKAVQFAKEALNQAGSDRERKEYENRLKLYENRQPFRVPAGGLDLNFLR